MSVQRSIAADGSTARTGGRPLLRLALKADALVTAANGAAYLAVAGPLGDLLGLPAGLLRGLGAALLVYAGLVWLAGSRRTISGRAATAVIAANAAWVIASGLAALLAWGSPSTAGTVWIVLQAVAVAVFAELQLMGLRHARR
jgi:hypothetical protein